MSAVERKEEKRKQEFRTGSTKYGNRSQVARAFLSMDTRAREEGGVGRSSGGKGKVGRVPAWKKFTV